MKLLPPGTKLRFVIAPRHVRSVPPPPDLDEARRKDQGTILARNVVRELPTPALQRMLKNPSLTKMMRSGILLELDLRSRRKG